MIEVKIALLTAAKSVWARAKFKNFAVFPSRIQ
jgi:hypothetical protein